jgi:hypothetical protein
MLSKLRRIFVYDPDYPKPPLQEGEDIILEGIAELTRGLHGSRLGALILTNRRLIWYETAFIWPLKKISGELNLSEVVSVDKGTWFDFIFGGRRLWLRLRNGKDKCLWEGQGRLDEWIATIGRTIASQYPRSN